jgi:hypothetical protein
MEIEQGSSGQVPPQPTIHRVKPKNTLFEEAKNMTQQWTLIRILNSTYSTSLLASYKQPGPQGYKGI